MDTIEKILITPEMALDILSNTRQDYQRPLRQTHVDKLVKAMKKGEFLNNSNISFCVISGTDKKYLVNGQHTLNAIFESGVSLELPVQIFYVENEEEVASHYSRIDIQWKRNRGDIFRAYHMEEKLEMSYTAVNRYGACVAFMLAGFRNPNDTYLITEFEIMDFMIDWKEHAKRYFSAIEQSGAMRIPLERREVFSIGLITCKFSKKADEFWNGVATDDGLRIGDPRKTLHNWLIESGIGGGNEGSTRKKRIVRTSESIRCVTLAWNAFIDGKQLKLLVVRNSSLPFTIKETPYKNIS